MLGGGEGGVGSGSRGKVTIYLYSCEKFSANQGTGNGLYDNLVI